METNEPKAYEIRTVEDFLKVPPDRITDCLAEFAEYVEMMRGIRKSDLAYEFLWVADGKRNVAVDVVSAG
jgi:hypothetical protein